MNGEYLRTALPILLLLAILFLLVWSAIFGFYLNRIGSRGRASVNRLLRTFRWASPLVLLCAALTLQGNLAWTVVRAHLGVTEAEIALAGEYYTGLGLLAQDRAHTRTWLERAAAQGSSEAQFTLAQMFNGGIGGPEDPAEALRWAHQSAAQANPSAMLMVGRILSTHPQLDPHDTADSVFRKARPVIQAQARQGDRQAEFALGQMLIEGWGGPSDPIEGYRWLLKASTQGLDPFKQLYVQSARQRLSPEQVRLAENPRSSP